MARYIGKTTTKRNHLPYNRIPTVRGSVYGYGFLRYDEETYDNILDCVYEMSDMIAESNGISIDAAISQVLKDEEWYILPSHRKMIVEHLST